jgi:hypothetical protein
MPTIINRCLLILSMLICLQPNSLGWVYPEHRDITLLAIQKLDSAHRAVLNQLWSQARKGFESRLNESVTDLAQSANLKNLDYAAWPAIAGDHSTSSENMLFNILHTDWILNVADVASRLKTGLAASTTRSERVNELRISDLRLLKADPEYVSRAGANNVHFMLARPDVNTSASAYFDSCFKEGVELNLVATYKWFHTSALLKARRLASEPLSPEQHSALVLSALADEAFALHFLEDAFSAGHVAGIWGNAALRKGTHDYYDEHGLEVTTWQGDRVVLMGDAYMRPQDAERAASSVLLSIVQILDASATGISPSLKYSQQAVAAPDTFNVAKAVYLPLRQSDPDIRELSGMVLMTTPVPGLATGLGEIPRFRSELGFFLGIQPAVRVNVLSGGFGTDQKTIGVVPGLEIALHIGLGLEGVLNESGDGLVFLDLGWRLDGASTIKIKHDPAYQYFGSILSAIPSREAFYFRFRMPFYVVPGDLLIAAPLMLLFSPESLNKTIATAGQGGLIPWQTGMVTPIGRFQFILGREIGVAFYGSVQGADAFLVPDSRLGENQWSLISMRSTQLEFPVLEYRPLRTFSRRQSASFVLQISAGVDIPGKVTMIEPADLEPVKLKPVWSVGFRLAFDWRYYLSRNKS